MKEEDGRGGLPRGIEGVAVALWAQDRGRKVARRLAAEGIPVLVLKGTELQTRLFGTPAAYPSGDLDVLVPGRFASRSRRVLVGTGWGFETDSGALWRWSSAAMFSKDGFYLDLHWGIHAGHLPSRSFRALERALWEGASIGPSGMYEPDAESLLVYLAVHAVGHGFARPEWRGIVLAARTQVNDWQRVWDLAARTGTTTALRSCLDDSVRPPPFVLDDRWAWLRWAFYWVARGHFVSGSLRRRIHDSIVLGREGHGYVRGRRPRYVDAEGMHLMVPRGVFGPSKVAPGLIRLALDAVEGKARPCVVDVGTGTGVLALSIARRRPDARVHAIDRSARAVGAARRNRKAAGERHVRLHIGELLDPVRRLSGQIDVVVAYLPYVDPRWFLELAKERPAAPRASIEGPGADGLGLVRELCRQAASSLAWGGALVLALPTERWNEVEEYAHRLGFTPGPKVEVAGVPESCGTLRLGD